MVEVRIGFRLLGSGVRVSWDGCDCQKCNDVCQCVFVCEMAVILPEPIWWPGFEGK